MKALIDVHFSHRIAELLRDRGLDAEAVSARADIPDSTPDAKLMELAAEEGRAVLTNNIKDFRPIAAARLQRGQGHAGLILVPSTRPRTKKSTAPLANALEKIMRANPEGLADTERWM